jgi:hypothetical protein
MFEFLFGDPIKKLKKAHAKILEEGMHAQRNGDMALFAKLSSEAEKIYQEILEKEKEKVHRD